MDDIRDLVENGYYQSALDLIHSDNVNETIQSKLYEVEIQRELGFHETAMKILEEIQPRITTTTQELQLKVEKAYLLYRELKISKAQEILKDIEQNFDDIDEFETYEGKIAYIKSYSLKGNLAWRMSNFTLMEENYEIALSLSQKINHVYSMIHSLIGLGNVAISSGDSLSAIAFYESALFAAVATKNRKFEAYCRNNLGEVYQSHGRITDAIEQFIRADNYFSSQMLLGPMSIIALNLGVCYFIQDNYGAASQYFDLSLQLSKEVNYKVQILDSFIYLILIRSEEDNLSEIENVYQEFLELFKDEEDKHITNMKKLLEGIVSFNEKTLKGTAKALMIFEEILKKPIKSAYKSLVYTYLIQLKLDEYKLFKQTETLNEIDHLFNTFNVGKQNIGPIFKIRILMLRAKFEEMKQSFDLAELFLRESLQVSGKFGLNTLNVEITDEIRRITEIRKSFSLDELQLNIDQDVIDSYLDHLRRNFKL